MVSSTALPFGSTANQSVPMDCGVSVDHVSDLLPSQFAAPSGNIHQLKLVP